jgi:hypothetical protein
VLKSEVDHTTIAAVFVKTLPAHPHKYNKLAKKPYAAFMHGLFIENQTHSPQKLINPIY